LYPQSLPFLAVMKEIVEPQMTRVGIKILLLNNRPKSSDEQFYIDFVDAFNNLGSKTKILDKARATKLGKLDYLLIKSPPNIGEEHQALVDSIFALSGVIIIASQILDCKRAVDFCKRNKIAILGLVELNTKEELLLKDEDQFLYTQRAKSIAKQCDIPLIGSVSSKEGVESVVRKILKSTAYSNKGVFS
jgi:hypothetical protein